MSKKKAKATTKDTPGVVDFLLETMAANEVAIRHMMLTDTPLVEEGAHTLTVEKHDIQCAWAVFGRLMSLDYLNIDYDDEGWPRSQAVMLSAIAESIAEYLH